MKEDTLLSSGSITLITGDKAYTRQRMHALIVEIALEMPVKLLIGGNRYDHYGINYAIAAATPNYEHVLDQHIFLSRAETCYQMAELLIQTKADEKPTLVLDLLTTFYDESVPDQEINQLLFEATLQLRRLSQSAPVVVSARPKEDRPRLIKVLANFVHHIERPVLPPLEPIQQYSFIE